MPSIIAGSLIVASLAYASILSTKPRVVSIASPTPTNQLNTVEYQQKIEEILNESILNRNKLTFRSSAIRDKLQERLPELGDIAVAVPLLGKHPVITISPSPATLIVANQQIALVVDAKGRAIADARKLSDTTNVITVNDESGLSIEQGKAVIPKAYVDFITTIKYQLDAKNIKIKSVVLPRLPNELHLRLQDKPYYVKFNLNSDPLQQIGSLIVVLEQLEKQSVTPVEYIDLRVEERVFYK